MREYSRTTRVLLKVIIPIVMIALAVGFFNTSRSNEHTEGVYETEDFIASVSLDKIGTKYEVSYISEGKNKEYDIYNDGPYVASIDKTTYTRLKKVMDYIQNNKEEFNRRASKYSKSNFADKSDGTLMSFLIEDITLARDTSIDGVNDDARKELEMSFEDSLKDIENVIKFEEVQEEYTIYTNIISTYNNDKDEAVLGHYYSEDDETIRVVDYDTYLKTWEYYTNGAEPVYTDTEQDYVIWAVLGFAQNVDTRLEKVKIKDGKIDMTVYNRNSGCMGSGGGSFMVIPVPKGTKIGSIKRS